MICMFFFIIIKYSLRIDKIELGGFGGFGVVIYWVFYKYESLLKFCFILKVFRY